MNKPSVGRPRASTLLLISIGCLSGLAQSVLAQDRQGSPGARELLAISPQDRDFRRRFDELLLDNRNANLLEGWRLAFDLGQAACPMLWQMWQAERSSTRRRIILLATASIAGGTTADDRLIAKISVSTADAERIMGMLALATGPERDMARPGLWAQLVGRRPIPALQVAAWLACSRFPSSLGGTPPDTEDPGQLAAALFAGVPVPASELDPWLEPDCSFDHRQLVLRGYLLGCLRRALPGGTSDVESLKVAKWLYGQESRSLQLARQAATLLLAHGDDPRSLLDSLSGSRPPWDVLQVLASTRAMREHLPGEWLGPLPAALDEDPRRISVEYGLARPLEEVLESAPRWAREEPVRDDLAVALAWRLLDPAAPSLQALPADVPAFEAWSWVRWAAGLGDPGEVGDPVLDRAAELAGRGGLPPEAGRRILEEALWRWGSHPGLGLWQAEHLLIRDLLLTGSIAGERYRPGTPVHERYLPKGIQSHDRELFPAALEYYEFVTVPRPPIPAASRLR